MVERNLYYFVPPPPAHQMDPRPNIHPVIHSADLFVTTDGLVYFTDYNAGLCIVQWQGHSRP